MNPSQSPTKRLFFALEIGHTQRALAARSQSRLVEAYPNTRLRLTAPQDLHVTLLFLGDQPAEALQNLIAIGEQIASLVDSFSLKLTDIGAFPDVSAPRVFWLGVQEDKERTASKLSRELRRRAAAPLADTMPFKPHLTLARVPARIPREVAAAARELLKGDNPHSDDASRVINVPRFVLMETLPVGTHTNPGESRYNTVHSFLLQKPRAIHTPAVNTQTEKVGN